MEERLTIAAKSGTSIELATGDVLTIVNPNGTQVVDTWALVSDELREHMSMEHTRASLLKIRPETGDTLFTNRRRAVLRIVEDSSNGIHDTLMPACDSYRYQQLGASGWHANCADNFSSEAEQLGKPAISVPSPFNIFMNVPISGQELSFAEPTNQSGVSIALEALLPCAVVMSACPQDLIPVNGGNLVPTKVNLSVRRGGSR